MSLKVEFETALKRIKEQNKKNRAEKFKQYMREYQKKDSYREYIKAYREKTKEKRRKYAKAYYYKKKQEVKIDATTPPLYVRGQDSGE